jgi:hypothetical protein
MLFPGKIGDTVRVKNPFDDYYSYSGIIVSSEDNPKEEAYRKYKVLIHGVVQVYTDYELD